MILGLLLVAAKTHMTMDKSRTDERKDTFGSLSAESGKSDDESKDRRGVVYYVMEYVLPMTMILFAMAIIVMFLFLGPTAVFKFILSYLPEDPGMTHAFFLGLAIVIAIVVPTPLWPPLMIVTAMVFGFWKGFLIIYCAMVLAAVISFGIGRFLMMQPFRDYIENSDYNRFRRFIAVVEAEGSSFKFVFLFRFLYTPIWMRNYLPSLLHVPFWQFLVSVLVHGVWICLIFAAAGTATKDMSEVIADGESPWKKMKLRNYVIFVVSGIATATISYLAYSEYSKKLEQEGFHTPLARTAQQA